jgi:hypothetical protein
MKGQGMVRKARSGADGTPAGTGGSREVASPASPVRRQVDQTLRVSFVRMQQRDMGVPLRANVNAETKGMIFLKSKVTCSSCCESRQCCGSRFFIQKMPAVTSGGTCSMYGAYTGFARFAGMKIFTAS